MKTPLSLLVLGACWSSSPQPTVTSQSGSPDVIVELAAVTLADDCGDPNLAPPPPPPTSMRAPMPPVPGTPAEAPADCSPGHCGYAKQACEQTSMQLSLRATAGAGSTNGRVQKVEPLDTRGKVLGQLTARAPAKWMTSSYVAWNQEIASNEKLNVTYTLSEPDWNKLGGRWDAHNKTFQLRVTVAVGSRDRVVEKQSIT